ncbi:MAG: Na(+)-translocating NADH-quinone reductase subunit A [Balneolaceae bacterium]|nr:Na(+)-translocating NADH-quinone reductase subunit A [Balneolaceae bacterium]MBO6545412.1 Na(+)-translocating NADH-quinone reductase subunit A [Balneolaceae bacterium]MBO6646808.1 Na(+)-translocating NADH-quinone reductase subunit A [Balneolaceae bacterium]
MSDVIKIKRGVDINLVGKAEEEFAAPVSVETAAIKPTDFKGVRFKLSVKEGDEVKAGTPLLYNKDDEAVKFTSPVSGEVAQVVRGAKRKILEVRVLADKKNEFEDFGSADPVALEREQVVEKMAASGCWTFLKQRPYNIVAETSKTPKAIFISGFDSAPLAPDLGVLLDGNEKEFQTGINALAKLTSGQVHLGLNASKPVGRVLSSVKGVKVSKYEGPHPAGLVGVQIAKNDPINKGETVWTINPEHVVIIGRLFLEGKFDARINIAMAGSEVKERKYYATILGAAVKNFIEGNTSDKKNRIISGNVLTGTKIDSEGYLGTYDRQITVIPEGEDPEMFGWLIPKPDKFSISRALPSWFQRQIGNPTYELDTNLHGERRAFVVTGQYEEVFPFDIYPVQLIKAIMTNDIERMENLGIYEVVEEDFALCEVVCTSKIPVQETVRKGLALMKEEVG